MFDGLSPVSVIFRGNSLSAKKLNRLYDPDSGHYNVITNLRTAMAKRYICNGCNTNTNATKLAPCVVLHHPVPNIKVL